MNVLLDNINSIPRAVEFANRVDEAEVWSQVGKAQLAADLLADAIASFIRANDGSQFLEVIRAASRVDAW